MRVRVRSLRPVLLGCPSYPANKLLFFLFKLIGNEIYFLAITNPSRQNDVKVFKVVYFDLLQRQSDRKRQNERDSDREREKSCGLWFTSQTPVIAETGLGQSQNQEFPSESPTWMQKPTCLGLLLLHSHNISKGMD